MASMGPKAAQGLKQAPWFPDYPDVDWPGLCGKFGDLLRKHYGA
jgi:hypothetical protein